METAINVIGPMASPTWSKEQLRGHEATIAERMARDRAGSMMITGTNSVEQAPGQLLAHGGANFGL